MLRRFTARLVVVRPSAVRVLRCPAPSAGTTPKRSAVNVEEFTLNQDVVEADLAAAKKWMAIGDDMLTHKKAKDDAALMGVIESGFALLKELGADAAPVNCEPNLWMELALAHLNAGRAKEALDAAEKAKALVEAVQPNPDEAQLGEIREFCAFATLDSGDSAQAAAGFQALLDWIDTGSSRAMPMVRVAAKAQRRTVLMGRGLAKLAMGLSPGAQEKTRLVNEALDDLIGALSEHLEEKDNGSAKRTLDAVTRAFEAVGEGKQAAASAMKLAKLCERTDDEAGAAAAKAREEALRAKFDLKDE